jgi:hypothetical protein
MNGRSAENGCFIKTRPSRGPGGSASGEWTNMVTNFNLTWKTACLEMLNFVRSSSHPILRSLMRERLCSSRNGHPAPSSKNVRRL